MPIKTIFIPLTDAEGAAGVLGTAFDLAATFTAHVTAVHLRSDPTRPLTDFAGESISPAMVEQVIDDAERRSEATAAATRKAFEAAAKKAGIGSGKGAPRSAPTASYDEVTGDNDYIVEERGRLADLIVVRRARDARDASARIVAETALMGTGRPVLLLPPGAAAKIGTNVAIAWNGSREAARAVGAALPFLTRATAAMVIAAAARGTIDQKGLIEYLSRQDVKAKGAKVKAGNDTGRSIVTAASRAKADLLVMGAYTHSCVRELIFGGVTEYALEKARIPVLMVH